MQNYPLLTAVHGLTIVFTHQRHKNYQHSLNQLHRRDVQQPTNYEGQYFLQLTETPDLLVDFSEHVQLVLQGQNQNNALVPCHEAARETVNKLV